MAIKRGDTKFEIGVPYPVFFRPINSGKALPDWGGYFVLDLKTLDFCNKKRFTVDYNHDCDQVIGYIDTNTFKIDSAGWNGDAFLLSLIEGDRAYDIIKRLEAETPYEVSPTLDMDAGTAEIIPHGETVTVNEIEHTGPVTIYRNVPVRGVSVCPYGRDNDTSTLLGFIRQKGKLNMSTKTDKLSDSEKTDDEKEKLSEETEEEKEEVKDEALAKFTKRFGADKGVKLYQSGANYDEIEKALGTLTKAGISRVPLNEEDKEEDKLNTDGSEKEEEPEPTPDDKKPDDELKKLKAQINSLENKLTKLSANHRGETKPISHSKGNENQKPATLAAQLLTKLSKQQF